MGSSELGEGLVALDNWVKILHILSVCTVPGKSCANYTVNGQIQEGLNITQFKFVKNPFAS